MQAQALIYLRISFLRVTGTSCVIISIITTDASVKRLNHCQLSRAMQPNRSQSVIIAQGVNMPTFHCPSDMMNTFERQWRIGMFTLTRRCISTLGEISYGEMPNPQEGRCIQNGMILQILCFLFTVTRYDGGKHLNLGPYGVITTCIQQTTDLTLVEHSTSSCYTALIWIEPTSSKRPSTVTFLTLGLVSLMSLSC